MAQANHPAPLEGCRVLIYGMNYAPEPVGVGKYTGELGQYLAEQGASVRVITTPPHYPGWQTARPYRAYLYARERIAGVDVVRCPLVLRKSMIGFWRLVAPLSFAISSLPAALFSAVMHRPKVVLAVVPTLFSAPIALVLAKLSGARTVLHVQDLEVDAAFAVGHLGQSAWLRRLALAFERSVLTRMDHVITISHKMADKLAAKGVRKDRISVVRNWVDISHIRPIEGVSPYRSELGISPDAFVVLYSGNIGQKQGLDVMLEAARLLRGRRDIVFVVGGDGPSKDRLVTRYGALPNVRFVPFQPYARFNEFLALADLHAVPQDKGAADLVLPSKLGAMLASGRAIVVTADAGTELALYLNGAADIIEAGSPERFAEAVASRADTPEPEARRSRRLALAGELSHSVVLREFAKSFWHRARNIPSVVPRRGGTVGEESGGG